MKQLQSACIAAALVVAATAASRPAWAQACCAGTGAVTPGRLAMHEDALVGAQVKAASVFGSFDPNGHFAGNPAGASELDFEQDVFGAVRVLKRGQLALLVPVLETHRAAGGLSQTGAGVGDVNLSARYDFVDAGTHQVLPGVAMLVGITAPTGRSTEGSTPPLAADATGTGAWQGSLGLALEQNYGPWLVNLSGFVAARTARDISQGGATTHARLAPQLTALAALGYTFPNDAAAALIASYTGEGDATIDGVDVAGSARRITQISLSGMIPVTDRLRLQGALFLDPPIPSLGANLPAAAGLAFTAVWSWS
jgi:hypothetical protein